MQLQNTNNTLFTKTTEAAKNTFCRLLFPLRVIAPSPNLPNTSLKASFNNRAGDSFNSIKMLGYVIFVKILKNWKSGDIYCKLKYKKTIVLGFPPPANSDITIFFAATVISIGGMTINICTYNFTSFL